MRFVFGKLDEHDKGCWYVDTSTASITLITECRQRGNTEFATQALLKGVPIPWDVLAQLHAEQLFTRPKFKYMNAVGGGNDRLTILWEVEAYDFPTSNILPQDCKISQWPNGKHFYARLPDGRDIEWNGQSKWNTLQAAQNAVKAFLLNQK